MNLTVRTPTHQRVEDVGALVLATSEDFDGYALAVTVTSTGEPVGFRVWPEDGFDLVDDPDVVATVRADGTVEVERVDRSDVDPYGVRWRPSPAPIRMRSRSYRKFPIGEVQERATHEYRQHVGMVAGLLLGDKYLPENANLPDAARAVLDANADRYAEMSEESTRGRGDIFYARLAADYVDLLPDKRVNTILAERRFVAVSTITSQVSEARRRDLLTRVSRGRPGGALTPKAYQLLATHGRIEK